MAGSKNWPICAQGSTRRPPAAGSSKSCDIADCFDDDDTTGAANVFDESMTLASGSTHQVLLARVGYAKDDLIAYYREIAPVILPYRMDRAVTAVFLI